MTSILARRAMVVPSRLRGRFSSSSSEALGKTPLYDFHVAQGAKMVPFGGFHMPIQYGSVGLVESHKFTRSHASLFDVSHMVQHIFEGPSAAKFLEKVTPADVSGLAPFQSRLSTLLWPETGGIVDDTIITRIGEEKFHVVTNAGCREKDLKYFDSQLATSGVPVSKDTWRVENNGGLVALQGPKAAEILKAVLATDVDLSTFYFGSVIFAQLRLPGGKTSRTVQIARGGYTGEDGFEISTFIPAGEPGNAATELTAMVESLMAAGGDNLKLAGLGARDTLRLEAGMCLYGHDLDDTTTPVEASLSWVIPPTRRAAGGFHGADVILAQLKPKSKGGKGVDRRRVGFLIDGPAPAREGAIIQGKDGEKVGVVTSGSPSPSLGKNIAMGYIKDGLHKAGTEVDVVIRNKTRAAKVTKMPFVQTNYWKGE
ncbi:hypothetical protein HOO65_020288 [Ceratocystis lukuohia]|uniref:Aminomethyltransferase n=2 Tax=Ceratocystis TaxID=5157 RepID=A0A2C5X599_9PEZI|nr:Aminomethyltransferase, mitochondrial [Ceratocystis fimbriata CBS 114723]